MIRTSLTLIALIAALLAAAPLHAQEAPRFFVERIEVRDHSRVSPEVVIYESRLREGAVYTETDLRDAAARLSRLPFLLGAEFALERGTERGRYTLIITINETRSFFYRLEAVPILSNTPGIDLDPHTRLGTDDTAAALGFRWFLGRRGALHVALIGREETEFTRGYSAFAVGYTQYDLFGTKAFATVNLKHTPEQSGITPQVVVGMPLSLNQTLTAEYDSIRVDYDVFTVVDNDSSSPDKEQLARLTWSYNTTNHPFVPTEGTVLTAGPFGAWRVHGYGVGHVYPDQPAVWTLVTVHTNTYGLQGSAQRYWEISDRNSVSLGAEAGIGHVRQRESDLGLHSTRRYNVMYGVVQGGVSRSLWSQERRAQGGDSRLELILRGRLRDNVGRENRFITQDDTTQATFSWVRHSSWGTLRVGVGYTW